MIKIKIDDTYQITSDPFQYILQETKTVMEGSKKGDTYLINVSYHGEVYEALQAYKRRQMRFCDATSIDELIKVVEELDKKLEKLTKGN